MNREEILKKAQEENKKTDYAYGDAYRKGAVIARTISIIVSSVLLLLEAILKGTLNPGYMIVWGSGYSGSYIYTYIKAKRKSDLILAIVYTALSLELLVLYIFLNIKR